jgi:hypothetical protein
MLNDDQEEIEFDLLDIIDHIEGAGFGKHEIQSLTEENTLDQVVVKMFDGTIFLLYKKKDAWIENLFSLSVKEMN